MKSAKIRFTMNCRKKVEFERIRKIFELHPFLQRCKISERRWLRKRNVFNLKKLYERWDQKCASNQPIFLPHHGRSNALYRTLRMLQYQMKTCHSCDISVTLKERHPFCDDKDGGNENVADWFSKRLMKEQLTITPLKEDMAQTKKEEQDDVYDLLHSPTERAAYVQLLLHFHRRCACWMLQHNLRRTDNDRLPPGRYNQPYIPLKIWRTMLDQDRLEYSRKFTVSIPWKKAVILVKHLFWMKFYNTTEIFFRHEVIEEYDIGEDEFVNTLTEYY